MSVFDTHSGDALSSKQAGEKAYSIIQEAEAYHKANEKTWSDSNQRCFDAMLAAADQLKNYARRINSFTGDDGGGGGGYSVMTDSKGQRAYAVDHSQRFASIPGVGQSEEPNAVGRLIVAAVTGRTSGLSASLDETLQRGTSSGYLLSGKLSSEIIDLARAKSVLSAAGMRTIAVESDRLAMVNVVEDPKPKVKIETTPFTLSTMQFGKLVIDPRVIGCMVEVSRELVEDAPNASELIENTLARALAVEVDRLGLMGDGTAASTLGILESGDIPETGSVGALTWAKIATEAKNVRLANHEPNAFISNTASNHEVLMTVDGQQRWLGAPPTLTGVTMLESSHVPTAKAIIGDFSRYAFGLRSEAMIEATVCAAGTFERHTIKVKCFLRGDFAILDKNAFRRMAGVTVT
jgi:HK97 family phage major capsid protein